MRAIAIISAVLVGLNAAGARADSAPWKFESHANPMDDSVGVLAVTDGPNGAMAMFACNKGGKVPPGWVVKASRFDIRLGDTRAVQFRIDHAPPAAMTWENAHTGPGAIMFGPSAVQLARSVAAAKEQFVFDTGAGPIVFGISGAADALARALQMCGL